MDRRVKQLITDFSDYPGFFDRVDLFTGPSVHFHLKTVAIRQKCKRATKALENDEFYENLYATLTAWGMHRMGRSATKLADLADIKRSLHQQRRCIQDLETLTLTNLDREFGREVAEQLWQIIAEITVGVGETKIVAGSKALHHVLPSLLPPIDRQYTIQFFYGHGKDLAAAGQAVFLEIFPRFAEIASARKALIRRRIGSGMHTSESKVVDNAIVGYMRSGLPGSVTSRT